MTEWVSVWRSRNYPGGFGAAADSRQPNQAGGDGQQRKGGHFRRPAAGWRGAPRRSRRRVGETALHYLLGRRSWRGR